MPLFNPSIQAISAGTTKGLGPEITFSNSNGVSFGMNNGVVTATVTPGAAAGVGAASAGTQLQTSGTLVFADSNGLSFGMSGSSQVTATMDALRVVSAGTTSSTLSQMVMSNSGNLRFGLNGSTITATAVHTVPLYDNIPWAATGAGAIGGVQFTNSHRSLFVAPIHHDFYFPVDVTGSTMMFHMSVSGSTATLSNSWTSDMFFGIYTLNGATLSLLNSCSTRMAQAAAATNNSTYIQSPRYISLVSSQWSAEPRFFAGSRYWLGWFWSSSNALGQTASMLGHFRYATLARSGFVGSSSANNTTMGLAPFYGIYSATTSALPTAISSNALNKQNGAAAFVPHMIVAGHTGYTVF